MIRHWPWLLCFLPAMFLWAPLPPDTHCAYGIGLPLGAHFEWICDTWGIVGVSQHLGYLFGTMNPERDRVGYELAIALPLKLMRPFGYGAEYAVGVAFNLMVVLLGFWLASQLVPRKLWAPMFALIATSDFVHAWFFSFHFTFCNLVIGLGCVYFFVKRGNLWLAAIGMTMYPGVGVWVPAALLGQRRWMILLAAIPIVLWHLSATAQGFGASFGVSSDYQMFSWLWHPHQQIFHHIGGFVDMMLHSFYRWAPLLALALILPSLALPEIRRDKMIQGCLAACALILGFNLIQGYYAPRILTGLDLVLFVALARLIPSPILFWILVIIQIIAAFLNPATSAG